MFKIFYKPFRLILILPIVFQITGMEHKQESTINILTADGIPYTVDLNKFPIDLSMALLAKQADEILVGQKYAIQLPFNDNILKKIIFLLIQLKENKSYGELKKYLPTPMTKELVKHVKNQHVAIQDLSSFNQLANAIGYLDIPSLKELIKKKWQEHTTIDPQLMNIAHNAGWYIMPCIPFDDPELQQLHQEALNQSVYRNINSAHQSPYDEIRIEHISTTDQFIVARSPNSENDLINNTLTTTIDIYQSKPEPELKKSFVVQGFVFSMKVSPDGKKLALKIRKNSMTECISIYSLDTHKLISELSIKQVDDEDSIYSTKLIAWLNNGNWLAEGDYLTIEIWDIASGKLIKTINPHINIDDECISFLAWSDVHRKLLVGDDYGAMLIYNEQLSITKITNNTEPHPFDRKWSSDQKKIISSMSNETVVISENNSFNEQIYDPHHKNYSLVCADLSPDAKHLAIGLQKRDQSIIEFWTKTHEYIGHIILNNAHDEIGGSLPLSLTWVSSNILVVGFGPDVHVLNLTQFENYKNDNFKRLLTLKGIPFKE